MLGEEPQDRLRDLAVPLLRREVVELGERRELRAGIVSVNLVSTTGW